MQAATLHLLLLPTEKGLGSLQIGSPAFYQILVGTYLYQEILDYYTRLLLTYLRKPLQYNKISMCSLEDYQTGWHQACKVTSSSLLGLHFCHYMAGVKAVLTE